ncbi:MAG: hypothetical protein AB7V18_01800 [Pyrinomonadaceae bacterium]
MNKDAVMVLHGFFSLPNLDKLEVVNAVNEYFDAVSEREAIRRRFDDQFAELNVIGNGVECKCCGREG